LRFDADRLPLVRLLDQWTPTDAPRGDVAARLAHGLGMRDAIALMETQAAIAAGDAGPDASPAGASAAMAATLDEDLQQLHATLALAIANDDTRALREDPRGAGAWHHRYLQLQRRMADAIGTLRNRVRQVLVSASPRLAQLALLDESMERLLARREQQALGAVPAALRARIAALQAVQSGQGGDLFPPPPDAWLDALERDFRALLQAELDLRLQTLTGLVEAYRDEANRDT
jgi:hypothetical protein